MIGGEPLTDDCEDLIAAYCDGVISDQDVCLLEGFLLQSEAARHTFVSAFHLHTELHFAIRARRAADVAVRRVCTSTRADASTSSRFRPRSNELASKRYVTIASSAIALILTTVLATIVVTRLRPPSRTPASARPLAARPEDNVAWLVNAQDCRWAAAESEMPGRDMRAGKLLRLQAGLAEIEFDRGARVILQGPAEFVLVSGSEARLVHGTLTAHVPTTARGFTILSPRGKVVDLGTEFGLSVDDDGQTTVRVFNGLVAAFPLSSEPQNRSPVTIAQDQTARIDGRQVSLKPTQGEPSSPRFIRSIEPPRVVAPRTLLLDFGNEVAGSLQDAQGRGIGLTHRLPGTGTALPVRDPNVILDLAQRILFLTTTRSDLNTQDHMPTGEYLGACLSDLGFTGRENFEISTTIPRIPGLEEVGQFGLYVGTDSANSIRGGLLSQDQPDRYHLFLVKNSQGFDSEPNEVGLMKTGDDLRLSLRRFGGRYSLAVEDLTRGSSNTLTINHPAFLDQQQNLYAGIFGANTQSDVSKTLNIKEVRITVWEEVSGG
jgi:hypothetical protein